MRYGIYLLNRGPAATPKTMSALALEAEQLGFDTLWVSDHIITPVEVKSLYPGAAPGSASPATAAVDYEPLITLAYAAGLTQRIRVGVSVLLVPLRNPVYAAKQIATLDALCGGRVLLGVGGGWMAEEFPAVGAVPFNRRGAALDEYIEIYRALWSDDEISSHDGPLYHLEPMRAFPKPVQRPGPPIWVGGHSEAAQRRALAVGSGWQASHLSPENMAAKVATLRRLAEERGRDLSGFAISNRIDAGVGLPAEKARPDQLFGEPARVAEGLARYEAAGCTDLLIELQPRDSTAVVLDSLRRLADVVFPVGR